MLPVIEKLLILQDRDRKILTLLDELAHVGPERDSLRAGLSASQAALDAAKQKVMHLESERKKLELEVESKKSQIEKYSVQQFQTKKNEEFRALGHEIDNCKQVITKLDDQQIELMEKIEAGQKEVAAANKSVAEAKKVAPSAIVDAMLAPRKAQLDAQVTAGRLTREQADTMLAQMRASITPQLSEPWTAKGPGNGDPGSAFVDKDGDGECDQMPEGGRQQAPAGGRGMQRGPRMGR